MLIAKIDDFPNLRLRPTGFDPHLGGTERERASEGVGPSHLSGGHA